MLNERLNMKAPNNVNYSISSLNGGCVCCLAVFSVSKCLSVQFILQFFF